MERLGKHVDRHGRSNAVTAIGQQSAIPRKGAWIARNIYYFIRLQTGNAGHGVSGSGARRIEQNGVKSPPLINKAAYARGDIITRKPGICNAVEIPVIFRGPDRI